MTESGPTRFGAPSDGLQLVRLYRETRRISYFAFALAMLVVAGTLGYFMALKKERPAPKPLSMEFIIRKPMAKKPFRMRKTQVQKRQITRKLVTSKPKLARTPPRSIRRNDALGNVHVGLGDLPDDPGNVQGQAHPESYSVGLKVTALHSDREK